MDALCTYGWLSKVYSWLIQAYTQDIGLTMALSEQESRLTGETALKYNLVDDYNLEISEQRVKG